MPDGSVKVGVFGKLPARGDFVREGLPRDFTDPWDDWWRHGIAATQAQAGDAWVASWLEAPVWRFVLPPGLCGREAALGVWMPSVDKVGRYFPLTIAAVVPPGWLDGGPPVGDFLAAAEDSGREALENDLEPDEIVRRAASALSAFGTNREDRSALPGPGQAAWWTEGGARVAPRAATGGALPRGEEFATLIDDGWAAAPRPDVAGFAGAASPAP